MDLDTLRAEIDVVNQRILDLFLQRMELAKQVGDYKRERNMPVDVPEREAEILAWARAEAGEALGPHAEALFSQLIALAKQVE